MRSLLLLATCLLASPAVAGVKAADPAGDLDAAYAPRRVALLVGVDRYGDPDLQTLSFAGKDAHDLAAVLRDPSSGGYDEVHVVTGEDATTAEGIRRAIARATADLQRDDTFLLYLSGHGTLTLDPIDGTRLWFLPSDGKLARPDGTALPVTWLEETLATLEPRRRVLILDTCHNGRSKSGISDSTRSRLQGLRGDPPPPGSVAEVSESEARLYAAQYYQPAMEDPDLQNGVYTHFLIGALTRQRGAADLNRDGLVDVVEAHSYAQDKTIRHTGGLQVPRAEYRIVGREAIYLAGDPSLRKRAEHALISAYDGLLTSARLLVNGVPRGELPGLVAVDPGRQRLEVQTEDGRTILARRVHVRAGDYLAVEDLLEPTGSRWTASIGASIWHGGGAALTVPATPELELGWTGDPSGSLLQPELHLRSTIGVGEAADLGPDLPVLAATGFVGGGFGVPLGTPHLTIGPEVEIGGVLRRFDPGDPVSQQALALAPGLRLRGAMSLGGASEAVLRYDVRVPTWRYAGDWTSAVAHGASLGVSFR